MKIQLKALAVAVRVLEIEESLGAGGQRLGGGLAGLDRRRSKSIEGGDARELLRTQSGHEAAVVL